MKFPAVSKNIKKRLNKTGWPGRDFPRRAKKFLVLSIFVFLAVLFARGETGILRIFRLHSRIDDAKREIEQLKVQAEDINWEIDKLKSDSTYIKLYAAERYGYAKAGETIIQFLPAPTDSLPK